MLFWQNHRFQEGQSGGPPFWKSLSDFRSVCQLTATLSQDVQACLAHPRPHFGEIGARAPVARHAAGLRPARGWPGFAPPPPSIRRSHPGGVFQPHP